MARPAFWEAKSQFPRPVWGAVGLLAVVGLVSAGWFAINRGFQWVAPILFVIGLAYLFYRLSASQDGRRVISAARARTWEAALVGLSFEGGGVLLLLGLGGFVAYSALQQIPQWALGVPQYAFAADRAWTVMVVAPVTEEGFFRGGLWSYVYNRFERGGFAAATVGTSLAFALYHAAAYQSAGPAAFIGAFLLGVVACVVNWAPTRFGWQPSLVPGIVTHFTGNGLFYWQVCVAGTQRIGAGFC